MRFAHDTAESGLFEHHLEPETKVSEGAAPGHGDILSGAEVTEEIQPASAARGLRAELLGEVFDAPDVQGT